MGQTPWIGRRTDRQPQGRITANCKQRTNLIATLRSRMSVLSDRSHVIGEEVLDPNVHMIQPGNIVFIDTHELLAGAKTSQLTTVFSTFNGINVEGMTNDQLRQRYVPYGVAAARGTTEGMYESDRAAIAVWVRGVATIENNGPDTLYPNQPFTCYPPDVDKETRILERQRQEEHSQSREADASRYVGCIRPMTHADCTATFSKVCTYLLEHTGSPALSIAAYDRAVALNSARDYDDVRSHAIGLKKFLAYNAFMAWGIIGRGPTADEEERLEMAVNLGLIEAPDGSGYRENVELQRNLFSVTLKGSLGSAPQKTRDDAEKIVSSVFREKRTGRVKFVEAPQAETNAKTLMRISNEASDTMWRNIAKMTEAHGDRTLGVALTIGFPGDPIDVIIT